MPDIWREWVGSFTVKDFVALVDSEVAAGTFRHRFAGFLAYARHVLADHPDARWTPEELAAHLMGYALDVLSQGQPAPK